MDKTLKLYTYVDGANDTPFPSETEQVVITDFQYDANRMGGSPSISAKIMHRLCLDDLWTDNVYAEFNKEKYFIMNTPSSNKDNDDTRYEHEIELLSEREVLNHVYFTDAVQGDSSEDVYKSNSTKVLFTGDIREFASRLNSSLSYSNIGYNVVIDAGIATEAKLVSFEDKYIMSALQEIFNVYEVPYYFVGKTIHIGYTDNVITDVFKYGLKNSLLSISKQNANYEVVRRCTGIGSTDNIPYYYPNESNDRKAIEASGKKWITPSQNLMPPIYRKTNGAERFYNAENNKYPSPEGGYYEFENLYSTKTPNEKIVSFEDIKPSFVGMTNASGQRIDQILDIAFDTNDNNNTDEEGNYLHPYFFVKLPKYNGGFGFNLFDQAIESGTMQISMTDGACRACTFEIGVGEETQKNIVQVDENGNLKRDESGNVLWENQTPQDRQNDTQNYEVWIALKKDDTTFGQIMPNASQNLKPSVRDTFVILNINLPQSYILAAEKKLEDSIIKYMFLNNNERFTFSVNFSRIYFAENPDVLAKLNENARILIEYNEIQHTLYVSSFSYKMSKDNPLPEISIDLTDKLSVGQNSLQNAIDSIKKDILSSIGGGDFLAQGLKYFIRKDINDVANGKITFNKGIVSDNVTSKNFTAGVLGTGYVLKRDPQTGRSYLEIDELYVRLKAYFDTLEIKHISHVGGTIIISPASMECNRVETINAEEGDPLYDSLNSRLSDVNGSNLFAKFLGRTTEKVYRCYFNNTDETKEIVNEFAVDDLALCRTFNVKEGVSENVSNQYYWRRVVAVGDNYIDLSVSDCDPLSTVPQAGDTIVTVGNKTDVRRQNVIMLMSFGEGSPAIYQYSEINSYSLEGKAKTIISPERNEFRGTFYFESGENIKEFITITGDTIRTEVTESILQILPDKITLEVSKQTETIVGDISEIRTDVSALQIKSDQISSQVVTINSTINAVVSTADIAQRIADKAYTKADSAQSAAASAEEIAESAASLANNASQIGMYGQESYNQTTNPWNRWSSGTEHKHVGALWYNPSTDETKVYVGTTGSNTWETISTSKYAVASYILQNSDKISAVVANFDSSGRPTSASGIITEAYGNTIWASSALEDGNELVSIINQTSTTIKLSALKINLSGAISANGTFTIDTSGYMTCTGGTIGGFTIKSNSLSCDGRGSSLTIGVDGGRFFRVNYSGSTGTMCAIRADSATCLALSTYGSSNNCIGLNITCNGAGYGYAIKSYGNVLLSARSSESIRIEGLCIATDTIGSGTTIPANYDFIRFTNTSAITVNMPPPVAGKILFHHYSSGQVTLARNGASAFRITDNTLTYGNYVVTKKSPRIWICDGMYWHEFYCNAT